MLCAGLDNAILGYLNADERKVDPKRIAQLLAHGAHALQAPDEEAAQEGQAFAEEVCTTCHSSQGAPAILITYLSIFDMQDTSAACRCQNSFSNFDQMAWVHQ